MSETLRMVGDRLREILASYTPNIVGALALLLVGWILALGLSRLAAAALRRTKLDNRIASGLTGDGGRVVDTEALARRGVFWLVMFLVIVGVLQILGLTMAAGPLNELLTTVFEFLPRLFAAVVLLLIAWLVATILRFVLGRVLTAGGLDRKLEDRGETALPVTKTITEAAYWLVFLFFLPAVVDALALEGLLVPIQTMLNEVLAFLPNLVAAGIILFAGWFVARIVRGIVRNLTAAGGADRLAERMGVSDAMGKTGLSGLLGQLSYVLVLVPVLIAALNALSLDSLTIPASNMLNMVLTAIPSLFAAVLLMFIAYLVGRVVARLIGNLLTGAGFDNLFQRMGLRPGRSPSEVAAQILLVAVMLFAGIEALRLIAFDTLADLVSEFLVFGGNVFLGLAIFTVGLYLAGLAARAIQSSGTGQATFLAVLARISILLMAAAMGLRRMGIADEIVVLGFGILVGAVAVAAAIAFGIGGRDLARKKLHYWWKPPDGS